MKEWTHSKSGTRHDIQVGCGSPEGLLPEPKQQRIQWGYYFLNQYQDDIGLIVQFANMLWLIHG